MLKDTHECSSFVSFELFASVNWWMLTSAIEEAYVDHSSWRLVDHLLYLLLQVFLDHDVHSCLRSWLFGCGLNEPLWPLLWIRSVLLQLRLKSCCWSPESMFLYWFFVKGKCCSSFRLEVGLPRCFSTHFLIKYGVQHFKPISHPS